MEKRKNQQSPDKRNSNQSKLVWNPPVFRRLGIQKTNENGTAGADGGGLVDTKS